MKLTKQQNSREAQVIAAGGKTQDIDLSIFERVKQSIRYAITGAAPDTWFGPLQPLTPVPPEPEEVKGRRLDYPFGYNIQITPRPYEAVTYDQLRSLADNCNILRLIIETVKDEIARMDWSIKPIDEEDAKAGKYDAEIKKVKDFLRYPDNENNWDQWMRMIFEEMLVTDATAVYMRRTKGKDAYALEQIDGATINLKINGDGRTPQPPDVAYQQILKGVPAVDFTRDELIYFPRNKRIWKFYGFSPVEQLVFYVNMALRRDIFKLNYYTEGNIPDLLLGVPDSWTQDQIKQYQEWWDSMLSGNLAQRRHGRFVPGEVAKNVKELKEAILKDEFDDWLARLVCFCFSISPQPFIKEMNRASAQTNQEVAAQQGLLPKLKWFKDFMDFIFAKYLNYPMLGFNWDMDINVDSGTQSKIDQIYIATGVQTPQQIAEARGLKWDEAAAAKKEADKQAAAEALSQAQNQNQGDQGNVQDEKSNISIEDKKTKDQKAEKLEKAVGDKETIIFEMVDGPKIRNEQNIDFTEGGSDARYSFIPEGRIWLEDGLEDKTPIKAHEFMERIGIKELGMNYEDAHSKLANPCEAIVREIISGKIAPKPEETEKLERLEKSKKKVKTSSIKPIDRERGVIIKARSEMKGWLIEAFNDTKEKIKKTEFGLGKIDAVVQERVEKILDEIDLSGWAVVHEASEEVLAAVTKDGLYQAILQIGLDEKDMTSTMFEEAKKYAVDRAAEMVGKKWIDGELVDNPTAKWVITDSTRDMLRSDITQAVEEGWGNQQLRDQLFENYGFSDQRAGVIASQEVAMADQNSNKIAYEESGVVAGKYSLLSQMHEQTDACDCEDNAAEGTIGFDETFESGDDWAPYHIGCNCLTMPVLDEDME
jgi:hypothetical protein